MLDRSTSRYWIYTSLLTNIVALVHLLIVVLVCILVRVFFRLRLETCFSKRRRQGRDSTPANASEHLLVVLESWTAPSLQPLVQRFIKTIDDQEVSANNERVGNVMSMEKKLLVT